MKYRIVHTTSYQYSSPLSVCHNVVMLTPRETQQLTCQSHRLTIRPVPLFSNQRSDAFGNTVHTFSLEENHSHLTITATSRVTVSTRTLPPAEKSATVESVILAQQNQTNSDWLQASPFLFDSPRIQRGEKFAAFAAPLMSKDAPILQAIADLTQHIFKEFKYDKLATKVDTSTESAFDGKRGVCQDFAHIAVACLRSVGIPARYVSGYLRTLPAPGKERLIGSDQSHAWVSAYCGSELGWVDFDPTNNCRCSTDHIPIAWGRDYTDIVPIKGVFLGGGEPVLTVSVDVAPASASNSP